jgi:hypothetical protein
VTLDLQSLYGQASALVRRQLTPGLISSLHGTPGSPPFIFFSTSYPEMDSDFEGQNSREPH